MVEVSSIENLEELPIPSIDDVRKMSEEIKKQYEEKQRRLYEKVLIKYKNDICERISQAAQSGLREILLH